MLCLAPLRAVFLILKDGAPDTLPARERYQRFGSLSDDKYICATRSKDLPSRVLHVHNVIRTRMTLTVLHDTNTTNVVTTRDHGQVADIEFDVVSNLASVQVNFDSIISFDGRIGVSEGATVVCDHEGNSLSADLHTFYLAQLVLGLLGGDAVDGETTLGIIQQTEVLVGLLDVDNVHETGRGSWGQS